MNKDWILKNTTSYEEDLLEDLQNPDEAQAFLEALFEAYEEDGNMEALLLAIRDVAKAQGGIATLAKRAGMNREYLYDVLANKHRPRFDKMLDILSGLGFRLRLERREGVTAS